MAELSRVQTWATTASHHHFWLFQSPSCPAVWGPAYDPVLEGEELTRRRATSQRLIWFMRHAAALAFLRQWVDSPHARPSSGTLVGCLPVDLANEPADDGHLPVSCMPPSSPAITKGALLGGWSKFCVAMQDVMDLHTTLIPRRRWWHCRWQGAESLADANCSQPLPSIADDVPAGRLLVTHFARNKGAAGCHDNMRRQVPSPCSSVQRRPAFGQSRTLHPHPQQCVGPQPNCTSSRHKRCCA